MEAYQKALAAYLEPADRTQAALADKIGKTQAAINRYVNGARFPDAQTARQIHDATDGAVPFELWQSAALTRLGIEEAA